MSGGDYYEAFEQQYAEQMGFDPEMIKAHRDGDGYSGNAHLEGAWVGWNLHEDAFMKENLSLKQLIKKFFVAFRAFGIYRSPIYKYKEDDYRKDVRERMEKLFEEACAVVPYDDAEINRMIDDENVPEVIVSNEDALVRITEDTIKIHPVDTMRIGELFFQSSRFRTFGYALPTARHAMFQRVITDEESSAANYLMSEVSSLDSEYVDLFVTAINGGEPELVNEVLVAIGANNTCPMIKTVWHNRTESEAENLMVIRLMISHGAFLSQIK